MALNLDFLALKTASESRDNEQKQRNLRHRTLMVLIFQYLKESSLLESADAVLRESKMVHQDISGLTVCDNMDLGTILLEYECSYFSRLQKKPKFIRECFVEEKQQPQVRLRRPVQATEKKNIQKIAADPPPEPTKKNVTLEITSTKLGPRLDGGDFRESGASMPGESPSVRLASALRTYETGNAELLELALIISKEMHLQDPNVHWSDIKGMEDAKRLVQEAVVYPVKYPELFKGILSPWKGLLLCGPPGTGKTMLAKAVATECKTSFFSITASTVVSKWRGESEKLIRILFDLARRCAPSTIFLDELDCLMGQRGEAGEHEGSRRMKTEILIQMDGLQKSDDLVFVLAASNLPWELDSAIIRRMEKRVFVDFPSFEARKAMFTSYLPIVFQEHPLKIRTHLDYERLAELTNDYSGSDIYLVCKEAAMQALRKIFAVLNGEANTESFTGTMVVHPIQTEDVIAVLEFTKPAETYRGRERYEKWKCQISKP